MQKSVYSIDLFLKFSHSYSPMTRVVTRILNQAYSKILDQLLMFQNFHPNAKNLPISSICSKDIVDLEILQSHLPRAFWPISQGPKFSRICALCNKIANNINFNYRPNSEKNEWPKYFHKFEKTFWGKTFFWENPTKKSRTTWISFEHCAKI